MILDCKGFYADEPRPPRSMVARLIGWYHGLFHLAQVTIHDRWVKRFRLIAFLGPSRLARQLSLGTPLAPVAREVSSPGPSLTISVAPPACPIALRPCGRAWAPLSWA